MSHPQPPQRQPTPTETINYARALHTAALVGVIACPLLALVPPRKLDLYTFGLAGGTYYSANHLVRASSGRSILQHMSGQVPDRLRPSESQAFGEGRVELEGLRQRRQEDLRATKTSGVLAEVNQQRSGKDWVAERDEDVKEALDEGKGFQDMIVDQIWEVWNWGKKRDDED